MKLNRRRPTGAVCSLLAEPELPNENALALEPLLPIGSSRKRFRVDPPLLPDDPSLPPQSDDSRREIENRPEDRFNDNLMPLPPPVPGLMNPAEFVDGVDGVLEAERSMTSITQAQFHVEGGRGEKRIIVRLLLH